jgi:Bacterial protein of unknown function (HtrL_YibB)
MAGAGKKLTLVTCLLDLATRERNPYRRTTAHYLKASGQVLGYEVDLVAFAEAEQCEAIAARRREAGLEERTLVVPLEMEELRAHKALARITSAREAHPLRNGGPSKDTPLYAVLQWSKFELIRRATELDPFAATHLGWIDIGLPGAPPVPADSIFTRPSDRVRLLQMRRIAPEDLVDRGDYYAWLRGHVAAGYVTAERGAFLRLCELFESESQRALDAGRAPSEEQLLPVIWLDEPELFEFHHGNYGHILRNYARIRGSAPNLIFQLRESRDAGAYDYGDRLGRAIVESHEAGILECTPGQLAELLDECYLAAWYADPDPAHGRAGRIADLYLQLAESDSEFRDVFLRHEVRVRSNFELLEAGSAAP